MVLRVTGGKSLPAEVQREITEKTDGVPLFVEELTKTILESGVLKQEPGRYVLSGSLSEVAIPATLHDSLMARLDRLGAVKEVAARRPIQYLTATVTHRRYPAANRVSPRPYLTGDSDRAAFSFLERCDPR